MRKEWPENIRDLLASEPDRVLASRLGVARTTIFRLRQKLGIGCYKKTSVSEALSSLVDVIEGSKYPLSKALVQAIQIAKQSLQGARSDGPDRSVC